MPIGNTRGRDVNMDETEGPTRGERKSLEARIGLLEDQMLSMRRLMDEQPTESEVKKDLTGFRHWLTVLEERVDHVMMYINVMQYALLSLTMAAHPMLYIALKVVDKIGDHFKRTEDLLDLFLDKYNVLMWTEYRRIQAQEARSLVEGVPYFAAQTPWTLVAREYANDRQLKQKRDNGELDYINKILKDWISEETRRVAGSPVDQLSPYGRALVCWKSIVKGTTPKIEKVDDNYPCWNLPTMTLAAGCFQEVNVENPNSKSCKGREVMNELQLFRRFKDLQLDMWGHQTKRRERSHMASQLDERIRDLIMTKSETTHYRTFATSRPFRDLELVCQFGARTLIGHFIQEVMALPLAYSRANYYVDEVNGEFVVDQNVMEVGRTDGRSTEGKRPAYKGPAYSGLRARGRPRVARGPSTPRSSMHKSLDDYKREKKQEKASKEDGEMPDIPAFRMLTPLSPNKWNELKAMLAAQIYSGRHRADQHEEHINETLLEHAYRIKGTTNIQTMEDFLFWGKKALYPPAVADDKSSWEAKRVVARHRKYLQLCIWGLYRNEGLSDLLVDHRLKWMKISVEREMNYQKQICSDEPSLYDGMEGRILVKDNEQRTNIIYDPSVLDRMDDEEIKEIRSEMDRIVTKMEDELVGKLATRTIGWVDELVGRTKEGLEEKFGIRYDAVDQEHLSIKIARKSPEEVVVTDETIDLTGGEDVPMANDTPDEESYYVEEEVPIEEEVEFKVSTAPDEEGDESGRFHSVDGEENMMDHPGV